MLTRSVINAIQEREEDTFYFLDLGRFRQNYRKMLDAFQFYWGDTHIAYSFKTNYIPHLCAIIRHEGGFGEVVSEMELYLARKVGFTDNSIYFNGPYKRREVISDFLLAGGYLNIDHSQEMKTVIDIAREHIDKEFYVGVRCALNIGQDQPTRFGFDYENGSLEDAIRRIEKEPNIKVVGFHTHLPFRSVDSFEQRVISIYKVLCGLRKKDWSYISMGGGYMGEIPDEAKESEGKYPTYEDYAKVVGASLASFFIEQKMSPKLLIEPGSAIVADTMWLVTTVIAVKNVRGKCFIVLSGSSYDINPSVKDFRRPIVVIQKNLESSQRVEDADMVGYTCIEKDCLYKDYDGLIAVGDKVIFGNVGSYSITMKPPFIMPEHAIYGIDESEDVQVLRHKQDSKDIFHERWNRVN